MPTPQNIVPTLQVMHGPMAGRLYQLDREVTIVGRNPDCDVILQPKSVSRKHAAIVKKGATFEVKDLGSTRGTLVNGQRLAEPIVLKDGDTLQIGEVQLTFNSHVVEIEEGDDEQSTVYAAIDVLNQSDRHFPLIKPEAKFRALRLIGQELGGTLVLSEVLDRIFNSLFEIFPRAERGFVLLKDAAQRRPLARDHPVADRAGGRAQDQQDGLEPGPERRPGDPLQRPRRRSFPTARASRTARSAR